jgi:acyl-CoA reductase-like NAD-dependent aldehyde dehydrogenase
MAVAAARKAFKGEWRNIASTERGELMVKLANLIEQHKETLATIETWDNGEQEHQHCLRKAKLTRWQQANHTQSH